jgi:predicted polyphosphate/ATP-dependent NAD kinase
MRRALFAAKMTGLVGMIKLGLIINPVAGIGGKVGLRGSDGSDTVARAAALGARRESGAKAEKAVRAFAGLAGGFALYTCAGAMGQDVTDRFRLRADIAGGPRRHESGAGDTAAAARDMAGRGVDLLLFAGGDGTARDVMDAVGRSVPVLGIPTGCKIHSAVYAINPGLAGAAVRNMIEAGAVGRTREAEVMDIDEELFRKGIVSARLYGYMNVPADRRRMQNLKSGRSMTEQASVDMLSNCIADGMERDVLYIVGSGSTMMKVKEKLKVGGTLLGVDLIYNAGMVCRDAAERQILDALDRYGNAKVIVTVIGGQGYIFGRGNQQISAAVLSRVGKENILIAMSGDKADAMFMRNLYIDTSDEEVNRMLCGYYRVLVGYDNYVMYKAVCE